MTIYDNFKHITGFELFPRQSNYFSDRIERKDSLFSQLATLYFSDRAKFNKIRLKIKNWLRQEQTETIYALAGYIYYICEDFKKAKRYFLKTISLNPNNLDNWIDLAFTLRHLGEYEVNNGIIFNNDYVIYYYKYLKLMEYDYSKLKKLVFEIVGRTQNV